MTRISIALATYNGASYLDEQLASYIRQSRLPDELVICDDNSSDDTVARAEKFSVAAPFEVIVVRNSANLGYTANFSKAASLCTGDIIFLSDQDDVWLESKIERLSARIEAGAVVALNDQIITDADGRNSGTVLGNVRALGFSDRTFVAGCCTAFTKDFAELALPFPEMIPFDNWVSLLADFLQIRDLLDEPLQNYRRHLGNTTQSVFALSNPTAFDHFARYRLADPRPGWLLEIANMEQYAARIVQRREIAEALAGAASTQVALEEIDKEIKRYRIRIDLLRHPRAFRIWPLLKLWRAGFYADFAGWKSAVKDLIRP